MIFSRRFRSPCNVILQSFDNKKNTNFIWEFIILLRMFNYRFYYRFILDFVKRKLFFSHSFYIFSDNKFIRRLQSLNLHLKKKLYIRFKRSHRNYQKFAKFIKKKNYLKIFIKRLYLKKKFLYFTFTNNIYTVKFPLLNIRNLYCKRRSIHINNVIY